MRKFVPYSIIYWLSSQHPHACHIPIAGSACPPPLCARQMAPWAPRASRCPNPLPPHFSWTRMSSARPLSSPCFGIEATRALSFPFSRRCGYFQNGVRWHCPIHPLFPTIHPRSPARRREWRIWSHATADPPASGEVHSHTSPLQFQSCLKLFFTPRSRRRSTELQL
jgi:hypothetical protein